MLWKTEYPTTGALSNVQELTSKDYSLLHSLKEVMTPFKLIGEALSGHSYPNMPMAYAVRLLFNYVMVTYNFFSLWKVYAKPFIRAKQIP